MATRKQQTAYLHIIKKDGVLDGEAIIEGTRIAVWHVVRYYYKVGLTVEEILAEWDYLAPAQVFSALAYYHDNQEEVDAAREANGHELSPSARIINGSEHSLDSQKFGGKFYGIWSDLTDEDMEFLDGLREESNQMFADRVTDLFNE